MGRSRLTIVVAALAAVVAAGAVVAGAVTARALRVRDAAVREGILLRAGHDLEREMRERGPDAIDDTLRTFLGARARDVSAVEVRTAGETIARHGTPHGDFVVVPAFLGPIWRDLAHAGAGPLGAHPPFVLHLWPSAALGDASAIAAVSMWGSVLVAFAVVVFALAAVRGMAARERVAAAESERRRLEVTALAGAGLAHRIRNPLATIKGTAQLLEADASGPARSRAARIVESSVRIERLVDELLRFAGPVEPLAEEVDLATVARNTAEGLRVDAPHAVFVRADPEHVTSAVEELLANARTFDRNGTVEVLVMRRGANGVIEVRDRGPGLAVDPDRAFDPYVTTRTDGTGLGLANVRSLIRANSGDVTIANREGGGCVATILLPLADGAR